MRLTLLTLALVACTGGDDKDAAATDEPTDTTDEVSDTDDPHIGPDHDGDGWTQEAGDCDDEDEDVNPGLPEDPEDDKDNDCDGRTDEVFAGVMVADNPKILYGPSALKLVSAFGVIDEPRPIEGNFTPYDMDERNDHQGWWTWDPVLRKLGTMGQDGSVDILGDMADVFQAEDPPGWIFGVATGSDAVYLGAIDRLYAFDPSTGDRTEVAHWSADPMADDYALQVIDIAYERISGDVYLMGVYGGLAKYNPVTGFEVIRSTDPADPPIYILRASAPDEGGVYVLASNSAGDYTIQRLVGEDWVQVGVHSDPSFVPLDFVVETESGDAYITAQGGYFQSVWRIYGDGSGSSQLWTSTGADESRRLTTLGLVYSDGPI